METTSKARTPSRCREWERQRRNKFNDAITKLGEAVKAINKVDNPSDKDSDNVQYPKIEIVQKAIACLTNCAQEKTQLKAELLALQVKIEASKQNPKSKDASTQVHTSFSKKMQNGKYVKLLMLQKSKRKALKEKQILTTNVTVEGKSKKDNKLKLKQVPLQPPKILPKSTINDKKRTENTIVVLPAAPYLFPQRPLFLPAVPPAFVIVDPNIQTLNKPSVPIVNRTGGDTTKTTMVNILPISAYSRPLSARKTKKVNSKSKNDTTKKVKKKPNIPKTVKEPVNKKQTNNVTDETNLKNNENPPKVKQKEVLVTDTEVKCSKDPITKLKPSIVDDNVVQSQKKKEDETSVANNKVTINTSKTGETSNSITIKTVEKVNLNENQKAIAPPVQTNRNEILKEVNISLKSTSVEDKDKENKLPNILDTSLCESGVDGGNARLELAEEFLAASPTAAFLMSFPLVSGNRADSPAEDASNTVHTNVKDTSTQIAMPPAPNEIYFVKPSSNNDVKTKPIHKQPTSTAIPEKQSAQNKYLDNNILSKSVAKTSSSVAASNPSNENPFLSLPMPSLIITTTQSDTFGLDFDCSISKSIPSQSSSYVSNSNLFYKSDPFNAVKSTIYSTSSIASGHEFNSLGLYPCAMEKYSKNKSDYTNVEDNLMKIGSSRLTYDIDLGWSHKGFDFVNCTTNSNTFSKDILTTATAPTYSSSYNPFNPEFHVPLVSASSKKDSSTKPMASFAETITSFYSTPQPTNLWSEDMCFYNNSSASKTLNKHQNYLHLEHSQANASIKPSVTKQYETKIIPDPSLQNIVKPPNEAIRQQLPEKYNKKSPNKMHINWMTSELRPMQNNCNPPPQTEMKEPHKQPYGQVEHASKKQDQHEGNYFPIAIHNFAAQPAQEDFQVWPSTRPLGTTEISIEPPPINLPTLVGDLALGPHDKKKNADLSNRIGVQPDIQNCGNFLSVTQLMNRSSDNATSRYHGSTTETLKTIAPKQNNAQFPNDVNRKPMSSRVEINLPQPCYVFNDPKHSYENMGQFSQQKPKTNKSDKSTKVHKNNYSAEALIRSGNCTQKVQDHIGPKFMAPSQKYGDFNTSQDTSVAQVSHFPPILDYSDNSYTGQQFSGTTLYNATTNTISNSFYSNFMSGSANIMTGSYTSAPFTGDFMDYNQAECNYSNNKYEEFKMRGNPVFQDKVPSNYKSSRRESGTKHKLECSKKESKKYQNKRAKVTETEEWSDANLFWQNKGQSKKGPNMSEELSFANYVGNGMAPQYQHELFNSHLVNAPADRSLATFPATSRANFNLSTIFPEITMKVQ
ncbi:uncharacterized protein LOC134792800 [Cydia splendana]|uniref:uncharacterized protein LOC134792800 n=1 Tax=Cydia splendana TaxID=1100963 RepID=UPI002123E003